jgi:acyl-CoA synthetase (NDP forming)
MNELNSSRQSLISAQADGRLSLNESEGKGLLAEAGIPVPKFGVAKSSGEAERLAAQMSPNYAVKVIAEGLSHKSDAGGVMLNLAHAVAVGEAVRRMGSDPRLSGHVVEGWLVEEMAPVGREFMVGGLNDPTFGPMVMVGLGGIFVEVFEDISVRMCPITKMDAEEMLDELRGARIIDGIRGEGPINRAALIDVMLRLGGVNGLLENNIDCIKEVDINPVIVSGKGAFAVDANFILSEITNKKTVPSYSPALQLAPLDLFKPLFEPETIAIVGASMKGRTIANTFIRRLVDFGYSGNIYPIHPKATKIEGFIAYPDLASTPKIVDYAYLAIGAAAIPDILGNSCGRVRFAQVISSGFAEVAQGTEVQSELIKKAHSAGVRILGPNCLGTYSPRGGLTFPEAAPQELGNIGVIAQSGGLSTDIIKRGQWRGLRFSGLVTIGNSADITPTELLEYYFADPQTKAIGLYLEDVKDGKVFANTLRSDVTGKPVVLLLGGRSTQGRLAAASHTGALASDYSAWQSLEKQANCIIVATLNCFIDVLLALQSYDLRPEKPTKNVTLFGNGGGSSVVGADIFANEGLDVLPFKEETRKKLETLNLPPGTSIINPVDTPVRTLQEKDGWVAGEILDIIYDTAQPDAIAMHLNLASFVGRGDVDPVDNLLTVVEQIQAARPGMAHFGLALRTDGSPELDDARRMYRERARKVKVPVFDEIPEMAAAFSAIAQLEQKLSKR